MKGWRKTPQTLAALIAVLMVVSLLPGLSGCSAGGGSLGRVLESLNVGAYPMSADATREVERFDNVFLRYAGKDDVIQRKHFRDVFRRIRQNYVEPIDDAVLVKAAILGIEEMDGEPGAMDAREVVEAGLDAMLASLDPHSSYMNPKEFRESQVSTRGQFGGLGIEITAQDDAVKVIAPMEDTPAAAAGIMAGDLITHVNGEDIRGKGLAYAVERLRGKPGSEVIITIEREGVAPFDVTIERAIISVRSVRWRVEGQIGYIRINRFTERVESGIVMAMNEIRGDLGNDLSGVVLDLRNNPGGLLDQSLILADAFLKSGEIVSIRGRNNSGMRSHVASPGDMAAGLPMVVLINSGSASASEIVAGALQDHGRATIMGERSFGKGSVQTITPLPVEGALRLTTSRYYAPSGQVIQAHGVIPNIILERQRDDETSDEITREADLPHALDVGSDVEDVQSPVVMAETCSDDENVVDLELACAIALLRAGSSAAFLSSVGAPQS